MLLYLVLLLYNLEGKKIAKLGDGSAGDSAGGSTVAGLWLGPRLVLWVRLWLLVGGWSRGSAPASGRMAGYGVTL